MVSTTAKGQRTLLQQIDRRVDGFGTQFGALRHQHVSHPGEHIGHAMLEVLNRQPLCPVGLAHARQPALLEKLIQVRVLFFPVGQIGVAVTSAGALEFTND